MPLPKRICLLSPVVGAALFVALYLVAARLYPGGSQANARAVGFSWAHNYWCNLLSETAINGQPNLARPVAGAAMVVLCGTLGLFWLTVPLLLPLGRWLRRATQAAGVLALLAASGLLTTLNHDAVTNTASLLAVLATTGVFVGLHKLRWRGLFWLGCGNLVLVGVNNLCYYQAALIAYLPIVQKITFAAFLGWVCGISLSLYQRARPLVAQADSTL